LTRTGRALDPSEGTKETLTRGGLSGVEIVTEPVEAKMRPQLCIETILVRLGGPKRAYQTYFASSP